MHGLRLKTSTAAGLAHSVRPELCRQKDVDLIPTVKQPTVEWLQCWDRVGWPLGLASQPASQPASLNQQASSEKSCFRNKVGGQHGGFAFTPDNYGLHLGSCKVVGDNQLLRVVLELP